MNKKIGKKAGRQLYNGVVTAVSDLGYYDVNIPPRKHDFKNVPAISHVENLSIGDSVLLGFLGADSQKPFIIDYADFKVSEGVDPKKSVGGFLSFPFQNYNRGRTNWAKGVKKSVCAKGSGTVFYTFAEGEEPGLVSNGFLYGNKSVYQIPSMQKVKDCPNIYADLSTWATTPIQNRNWLLDWVILGVWNNKRYRVFINDERTIYRFKIDDFNSDSVESEQIYEDAGDVKNYVFSNYQLLTNDKIQYYQVEEPNQHELIIDDVDVISNRGENVRVGYDNYLYWVCWWDPFYVYFDLDDPVYIQAGETTQLYAINHNAYGGGAKYTTFFPFDVNLTWKKGTRELSVSGAFDYSQADSGCTEFAIKEYVHVIVPAAPPVSEYSYLEIIKYNYSIINKTYSIKYWDQELSSIYESAQIRGPHSRPHTGGGIPISQTGEDYLFILPYENEVDSLEIRNKNYYVKTWDEAAQETVETKVTSYNFAYGQGGGKPTYYYDDERLRDLTDFYFFGDNRYCYFVSTPPKSTVSRFPAENQSECGTKNPAFLDINPIRCSNAQYHFYFNAGASDFSTGKFAYNLFDHYFNVTAYSGEIILPFTSTDVSFYIDSDSTSTFGFENCVITDDNIIYFIYEDHTNAKIGVLGLDLINKSMYYHYQQDVTGDAWPATQKLFFYGGCMALNCGDAWKILN